jgi:pSer/pThr/pTyr-binding forkhead associated (FHA) protein
VPELSLEIVEGAGAGRRVALAGPVTVGRGRDADLVLADELVSRHHAQVTPSGSGAVVEDLGSRNGTFVNGEGIPGPTRLEPGDQLQLGVTLVELRSARQIAERPSAVHPVPPPLAVPARTPDYLAGTDPDQDAAPPAVAADPRATDRGDPRARDRDDPRRPPRSGPPVPAAPGPAGRPRHELDPLLDSRTKGKARTAPLALFVLVALVVIIYLAASR